MRKIVVLLLAVVLLLTGCVFPGESLSDALNELTSSVDSRPGLSSFDEIEYIRPDIAEFRQIIRDVKLALESGSYDETAAALDDCYGYYNYFDKMLTVAYIRANLDVTDSYYATEYAWCEEQYPVVSQLFDGVYYDCAASSLSSDLAENYFWDGFLDEYGGDADESYYSDTIVELMQQESNLLAQYRQLIASPVITLDGVEQDFYTATEELYGQDYSDAVMEYYYEYNQPIAEKYIELCRVRDAIALEAGYESYEQLQYYYNYERDYTPEAVDEYLRNVREQIVPLYKEMLSSDYYLNMEYYPLDNGSLDYLVGQSISDMGGRISEAYDFMTEYNMYDISFSNKKANTSFQTYITELDAPYLFVDPVGSTYDIFTFAHEFGHYADAFVNYNAYETIDVSEFFSQGMEYLMLYYVGNTVTDDELAELEKLKLVDTLETYVMQGAYAEFESEVFALSAEERTVEKLNELSLKVARDYGFCDESIAEYYALSWVDIPHFFEMPFYVITYPVSIDVALQIFEAQSLQSGDGFEKYNEMLQRDGSPFLGMVESAGLTSPFELGRVALVAEFLSDRMFALSNAA